MLSVVRYRNGNGVDSADFEHSRNRNAIELSECQLLTISNDAISAAERQMLHARKRLGRLVGCIRFLDPSSVRTITVLAQ